MSACQNNSKYIKDLNIIPNSSNHIKVIVGNAYRSRNKFSEWDTCNTGIKASKYQMGLHETKNIL